LLLLVLGLWNARAIGTHKRLAGFTSADFELLRTFLVPFHVIVTTAHVLTEVSNLAGTASGPTRNAIFQQLANVCEALEERTTPAAVLCHTAEFGAFGLTDAAVSLLCSEMLLLTEDGRLAYHLQSKGMLALTLKDLRLLRERANHG
jgi:hypothetical protein